MVLWYLLMVLVTTKTFQWFTGNHYGLPQAHYMWKVCLQQQKSKKPWLLPKKQRAVLLGDQPKRWLKVWTSRSWLTFRWDTSFFLDLLTPRLETSQFVYLLTFNLDVGLFTCYQYVSIVSSYTHRVCDERHPLVQQHVRTIMSWGTDLLNLQPRHSYMESEIATYILRNKKKYLKGGSVQEYFF